MSSAPAEKRERDRADLSTHFGYRKVSPNDKTRLVKEHFDRVSPYYDWMNTVLSFGLHYAWKRAAVRLLGLGAGERVLDVCGGTGDLARLAARAVGPTGSVILYDINRRMMEEGRAKGLGRAEAAPILWVQGDAERIAGRSGLFDAAMVGFGIRNVTRWQQGFQEMFRVLKPGGRLLCLEFSQPTSTWFRLLYDFYSFRVMPRVSRLFTGNRQGYVYLSESIRLFPSPDALKQVLEDLGFASVSYRRLTNGIAVAHVARKGGDEP